MFKPTSVVSGKIETYYSDTKHDPGYYLRDNQGYSVYGSGARTYGFVGPTKVSHVKRFAALAGKRKVRAVDITLSSPKSVSMAAVYGNRKQRQEILKGRERTIKKIIKYLESNGYFRVQKKENSEVKSYPGKGMAVLDVLHMLSRNLDPQLHNHLLIANCGFIEGDPQRRAVDFTPFYIYQKHLTQVFRSFERTEMEAIGFNTRTKYDKDDNPYYELETFTDEQIEEDSSRSKDIHADLAKQGLTRETATGEQLQKATLSTRRAKILADKDLIEAGFHQRKIEKGFLVAGGLEDGGVARKPSQQDVDRLTTEGLDKLIGSQVTYTRQDVLNETIKVAAKEGLSVDADRIKKAIPKAFLSAECFRLPGQQSRIIKLASEEFISRQLICSEERNNRWLIDSTGQRKTLSITNAPDCVTCTAQQLFDFPFEGEQRQASIEVLECPDMICGIMGDPGTGKTTVLRVVAEVYGRENMIGLAVSGIASQQLKDETGMAGATIAKFLIDFGARQKALKTGDTKKYQNTHSMTTYLGFLDQPGGMIVIDEAWMVGEVQADRLAQIARGTGSKLVMIGDTKRLQAVAPGTPFDRWIKQGMQASYLTQIRRQENEADRKAVEAITLRQDAAEAVKLINAGKCLEQIRNNDHRLQKTVDYWMERRELSTRDPLLITGLNKDKDALNQEIRKRLGLTGTGKTFTVATSDDKLVDREFVKGDKIAFLKPDGLKKCKASDDHKILNGEQGEILEIKGGKFKVAMLDEAGNLSGITTTFDLAEYKKIDHAYALTVHKSQGQSVPDAIYSIRSNSGMLNKIEFLVGISRHKKSLRIFTDDIKKMQVKADQWSIRESGLQRFLAGIKAEKGGNEFINLCRLFADRQQQLNAKIAKERQQLIDAYESPYKAPKAVRAPFEALLNASRSAVRLMMDEIQKSQPIEPNPVEERLVRHIGRWLAKQDVIAQDEIEVKNSESNRRQKLNASDKKLIDGLIKDLPEKGTLDFKAIQTLKTIEKIRGRQIEFEEIFALIEDAEDDLIDQYEDGQDDYFALRPH